MRLLCVITLLVAIPFASAQTGVPRSPYDEGIVGLARSIKQLQSTVTVLHTVAHPDDEDGPLLAYCARGLGVRTLLFSITRGEGGANLIAPYFFDKLGALRTLEHYKSAGYYGNELFYSHATDYGYSKTLDEANRQWQEGNPILADLVEVIRRERPTILLSRFRGDLRDGHGHHQMAGVLTKLAFEAAADANRFPDQIKNGLKPWKVAKLYSNNIRPGRQAEDENAWSVNIPTGTFDPLLGRSYAQVARFGLGFQRSQGISGHWGEAGARPSYYRLIATHLTDYKPKEHEESILDGIDSSIVGLKHFAVEAHDDLNHSLESLQQSVDEVVNAFDPRDVGALVPRLVEALVKFENFAATQRSTSNSTPNPILHQIEIKVEQLKTAIVQASGLSIEVWVDGQNDERFAIAGQPTTIQARIVNPTARTVAVKSLGVETTESGKMQGMTISKSVTADNEPSEGTVDVTFGSESVTKPYWSRPSIREPLYTVDADNRQQPFPRPPAIAVIELEIDGKKLLLRQPVEIRFRDPELGNVRYPLSVVPRLSVGFSLQNSIVPLGHATYQIDVEVSSATSNFNNGTVELQMPKGWTSKPVKQEFETTKANEKKLLRFSIELPRNLSSQRHALKAIATIGDHTFLESQQTITARDLNRITLFKPAVHQVQTADVKIAGHPTVAYINGSGDEVAAAISSLGIKPKTLSEQDLESGDLSVYNVILVGVRAYAVRPDVRRFNHRLLNFVKEGGTLIVQYQTPEFDQNFGPYPYKMGRFPEEVSEEDSIVTILEPDHPIFNHPNTIVSSDFDGWFEQRGSKFWESWDDRYTPLLECHDMGQSPQKGGMLIAEYGKGVYVYSAYAWYRQLPNAVPGAFRIFANLLSEVE